MPDSLTHQVLTKRIKNAVVAGTTDQDGTTIDMAGYDAVRCIALLGTLTTTHVTKLIALQGDLANGSDAVAITGADSGVAGDADSNEMLILDVIQPRKRYITFRLDRGTANAVLDGMIVEMYKARDTPVTADATVTNQAVVVPAA